MKKAGKRIWVWILSGLTVLIGACHFHRTPATLYGPPEELYGPPAPKMEADTLPDGFEEKVIEEEEKP